MERAARPVFAVALMAVSQPTLAQAPDDVLRLYQPLSSSNVLLVDDQGTTVHRWPTQRQPRDGIGLTANGTLVRSVVIDPDNGVQEHAFDGTVLWEYKSSGGLTIHHDIEPLPNGNVLVIVWETKPRAQVVAAGRNPANFGQTVLLDGVLELQPTGPTSGAIVWEWHVWDHLVQDFDPLRANYGVVANHPELIDINHPAVLYRVTEFTHLNGLDYDPIHDWIVISSPVQNEIWIIDHSTTTAEAAGHSGGRWGKGGDLLYRWGNPLAYRAGTANDQQLHFQHDPRFIPPGYPGEGNVTVFDNRVSATSSRVVEIVLPVDPFGHFIRPPGGAFGPVAPVWTYSSPALFSHVMSSAERLPSGNTLVCSAVQRWVFEVTPTGQIVWQQTSGIGRIFHAHHTRRSLWADRESLSAASGGTVQFDLEAGSRRAGEVYVMLGSASGTSPGLSFGGVSVPLNPDGYFTSVLGSVGRGVFASWVGVAGANGGARATYSLPALPFLAGLDLDHAMLTIDSGTSAVTFASNAVPLAFQP